MTLQYSMPLKEKETEKLYYSITEVAEMFDVNSSLIRYWEKEFTIIKPHKNKKGNRMFTAADIEAFRKIYHLVKERGYTLQGAREKIKQNREDIEKNVGEFAGMPLLLKSTRGGAIEIAKLYAVGRNFRYGADVRHESDPVGLITSFSHHVFNDPDKLLTQTQESLLVKQKSASELEKISTSFGVSC